MRKLSKLRTRIDKQRGIEVVGKVLDLYETRTEPFDRPAAKLPLDPEHMPKTLVRGSREHRLFLFHINYYMRGGVDSNEAVKMLSRVFDTRPEFFNPYFASRLMVLEDLGQALQDVGLNYSKNRTPKFWQENAKRLVVLYGGDPGNIFKDVTTYAQACGRIQNDHKGGGFKGFQKKMVSMITYFFMKEGFVSPFDFPIPVDIHVGRLTLSNEIVKVFGVEPGEDLLAGGRSNQVFDAARKFYLWLAEEKGVDPLALCDAMWMYSRLKCSDNPENEWLRVGDGENRNRTIVRPLVDYTNSATLNRWSKSCGSCQLSDTCVFNFGAAPYYTHGSMYYGDRRRGPVDRESIGRILPPEEMARTYSRKPKTASVLKESTETRPEDPSQMSLLAGPD